MNVNNNKKDGSSAFFRNGKQKATNPKAVAQRERRHKAQQEASDKICLRNLRKRLTRSLCTKKEKGINNYNKFNCVMPIQAEDGREIYVFIKVSSFEIVQFLLLSEETISRYLEPDNVEYLSEEAFKDDDGSSSIVDVADDDYKKPVLFPLSTVSVDDNDENKSVMSELCNSTTYLLPSAHPSADELDKEVDELENEVQVRRNNIQTYGTRFENQQGDMLQKLLERQQQTRAQDEKQLDQNVKEREAYSKNCHEQDKVLQDTIKTFGEQRSKVFSEAVSYEVSELATAEKKLKAAKQKRDVVKSLSNNLFTASRSHSDPESLEGSVSGESAGGVSVDASGGNSVDASACSTKYSIQLPPDEPTVASVHTSMSEKQRKEKIHREMSALGETMPATAKTPKTTRKKTPTTPASSIRRSARLHRGG